MNIQSLSVVVPTHNSCVNGCKFCVSRTHTNPYEDRISSVVKFRQDAFVLQYKDYFNRLQFARDNGCNVIVLTGTGEPIQNMKFIRFFSEVNSTLATPFKSIELQTTGVILNEENLDELRHLGVTTISFSISNVFDNNRNLELIDCAEKLRFDVFEVIKLVKKYDFNLRLSLNLVNDYDKYEVEDVINRCVSLGADQVTFRKLYKSELNNEIDKWIEDNASVFFYVKILKYVHANGKFLGILPFGAEVYDINEMSMVIDRDCMAQEHKDKDTYKYLILRENIRLYTNWFTKASLVF